MATNGNNGGNVNYSSPGQSNMGITGNLQNRMAGKEYSERFYREKSGYLDNSITEVQNLLKYYEEISAITKDLSKTEQNRFKKQQDALKEQLKTLEYVKDTREIDFEDSVKLIREANKLLISGSKEYQRIMEETQDSQSKADKEHLGNLEEASETINKIRENAEKTNQDMKDTAKTLNNTSANFGNSLSNTLKSAGDFAANLSNMLSLNSLANNAAEQNLRSKLNVQNSVMKQFGMTSNSQYNQFKGSLISELKNMNSEMGALFSADDLYSYFERMGELGITNQKVAEEQLRASVLGNKYLGVSTETQSLIFKFMRNTNNNEAMDKHNKTIAGLLKAQLGVSKEQLDQMSKTVYSDADVIAALGGNADKYTRHSLAAGAVIDSVSGNEGWGDVLTKTLGQLVTSSPDEMGKWAQIFGSDAQLIKQLGINGNSEAAIRKMIDNDFLKGIISSGNTDFIAQAMKDLGIDATLLNINRYFSDSSKMSEYDSKIADSLASIESMTDDELKKYVEDTSELTALEKLENSMSFVKDEIDSWNFGGFLNLANIALGLYIASGFVKTVGGIFNFLSGGGLSKLLGSGGSGGLTGKFVNMLGKAGPIAGVITAVAASAVAGITAGFKIYADKVNEASQSRDNIASGAEKKYLAQGKSAGASAMSAFTEMTQKADAYDITSNGGLTKELASELGIKKKWNQSSKKEIDSALNKYRDENAFDKYNKIKFKIWQMGGYGELSYELLGLLATLNLKGLENDDSILGPLREVTKVSGLAADTNTIKEMAKELLGDNARASSIMYGIDGLKRADLYPMTSAGKYFSYDDITEDMIKDKFDLLKKGRMYIPYDNYPALLHEGEAVLTKSQAKRYRDNAYEPNVGGQSDTLYSNQQKIVLGKIVPSKTDVGYAGAQMGLPSGWSLTSGYGTYTNMRDDYGKVAKHRGLDFAAPAGTQIRAANSGKIYSASYSGTGFGNSIKIATDSGVYNRYGHMTRFALGIRNGMKVRRGQLIGYVGSTGNSTGPHLHFQVDKSANDRDDINPWPYVMMEMFGGKGALGVSDVSVSGSNSATSATSTLPKVTTARFINGASAITSTGGGESNVGGADRVVNSVDGGFNRLIAYLDNISKRQDEQQILIEAFSKSRASGKDL